MSSLRKSLSVVAALCVTGLSLLASYPAIAQESTIQKEEREERAVSMSEQVYKRLSVVHELIGEKQNAEALDKLASLEKQRLSPYEQALVYQAYGYVYINKNDTKRAIEYFEKTLATDALPNFAQQGMLYSLAGLYASEERYQDAIRTLTTWFKYEQDPPADANILMASSHFELKQYDQALPWVQEAIRKRAAEGKEPKESWYQLELAVYFEGNRYSEAAKLLRQMLALWPDEPKYWKTLSGVYTTLEKDADALAVMMLAYEKGHLNEEKELLNLVRLNLFLDIPYTGGVILDKEMKRGRIQNTEKNLLLLKQCWNNSREYDRTIEVLRALAEQSSTGEFDIEMAQIYVEKTDWDGASAAARAALDKGGLKKPGNAWLLLGMSLAEGGKYNEAERALRQAKKFTENRVNERAQGWLDYINDRRQASGP